jgi:SAM-dependent methyltransferase
MYAHSVISRRGTAQVDFGLTATDYARHRAGFPASLFVQLAEFGIGLPEQCVVDLGTGAGTLARGFAGRGCRVTGIDIARALMEQARVLDAQAGVRVEYLVARAEETGLESASADTVSAGQCWHWFDRGRAAREAKRLLRRDGQIVIAHFDWLPLSGNVAEATEALIQHYNPTWKLGGGTGLYPVWLRDLAEAGFTGIETFSHDIDVPYTPEAWRGRIRASAGIGASLPPEQIAAFDGDLMVLLETRFPGELLQIPHRVWAVVGRHRHAGS